MVDEQYYLQVSKRANVEVYATTDDVQNSVVLSVESYGDQAAVFLTPERAREVAAALLKYAERV